jgi:hypothetical protein
MSLHNNSNFAFKDVLKIQSSVIEHLTKLMASMLTKLNQTEVENSALN